MLVTECNLTLYLISFSNLAHSKPTIRKKCCKCNSGRLLSSKTIRDTIIMLWCTLNLPICRPRRVLTLSWEASSTPLRRFASCRNPNQEPTMHFSSSTRLVYFRSNSLTKKNINKYVCVQRKHLQVSYCLRSMWNFVNFSFQKILRDGSHFWQFCLFTSI